MAKREDKAGEDSIKTMALPPRFDYESYCSTALVLTLAAIAIVAAIAFIVRQRRAANPLYDLDVAARRISGWPPSQESSCSAR